MKTIKELLVQFSHSMPTVIHLNDAEDQSLWCEIAPWNLANTAPKFVHEICLATEGPSFQAGFPLQNPLGGCFCPLVFISLQFLHNISPLVNYIFNLTFHPLLIFLHPILFLCGFHILLPRKGSQGSVSSFQSHVTRDDEEWIRVLIMWWLKLERAV